MNRNQIQPGMRVKITPSNKGFKASSYTGTIGSEEQLQKKSNTYWDDFVPVIRDGKEIPQPLHCSRLTPLDPNDDHLLLRGGQQGQPGNSPGGQNEHHADYERYGQETHQEVQSNSESS